MWRTYSNLLRLSLVAYETTTSPDRSARDLLDDNPTDYRPNGLMNLETANVFSDDENSRRSTRSFASESWQSLPLICSWGLLRTLASSFSPRALNSDISDWPALAKNTLHDLQPR